MQEGVKILHKLLVGEIELWMHDENENSSLWVFSSIIIPVSVYRRAKETRQTIASLMEVTLTALPKVNINHSRA